jgi:hypothetical protein
MQQGVNQSKLAEAVKRSRQTQHNYTNVVTCDERGRIVRFAIQEGKGELRDTTLRVGEYGKAQTGQATIQVFYREGHGVEFPPAWLTPTSPLPRGRNTLINSAWRRSRKRRPMGCRAP